MLKCLDCGWKGEEYELDRVEEPRGEFWGVPCSETMYYCPCCGSEAIDDYRPVDGEEEGEDV